MDWCVYHEFMRSERISGMKGCVDTSVRKERSVSRVTSFSPTVKCRKSSTKLGLGAVSCVKTQWEMLLAFYLSGFGSQHKRRKGSLWLRVLFCHIFPAQSTCVSNNTQEPATSDECPRVPALPAVKLRVDVGLTNETADSSSSRQGLSPAASASLTFKSQSEPGSYNTVANLFRWPASIILEGRVLRVNIAEKRLRFETYRNSHVHPFQYGHTAQIYQRHHWSTANTAQYHT